MYRRANLAIMMHVMLQYSMAARLLMAPHAVTGIQNVDDVKNQLACYSYGSASGSHEVGDSYRNCSNRDYYDKATIQTQSGLSLIHI